MSESEKDITLYRKIGGVPEEKMGGENLVLRCGAENGNTFS